MDHATQERSKRQRVMALLKSQGGVARPRDLDAIDVSREYLNRLYTEGVLDRPSRGLYVLTDWVPGENQSLIEVAHRVPAGVMCLLTALRFHDLTTESPFEVWLAIAERARKPRLDYPPLRVVRFSALTLRFGVERHRLGGVVVPVYSPAKTVADCFKYRNKIGLEVAIAALRDCYQQRKASMDELWEAAKVCRMSNIMRPYLESLV